MIGCSMGASASLSISAVIDVKFNQQPFIAQVAMSVPYCWKKCISALERPGYELHNAIMTEGLQSHVIKQYDILKKHEKEYGYDLDRCLKTKRIQEFDKLFMVPINGFSSIDELYMTGSSKYHIPYIKIPTLLFHSMDDPICIKEAIPF